MRIIECNLPRNGPYTRRSKTTAVVLHHAAASSATVWDINDWHLGNGWNGIGYHYYIRKDGSVYRGRPEWAVGAHAIGANDWSIGVCCEGDYMTETMPVVQLDSLKELLRDIMARWDKLQLLRHKDVSSTDCPGDRFPWTEVQKYMEDDEMDEKQVRAICAEMTPNRYKTVDELPAALQPEIREMIAAGALRGQGGDKGLDLTEDMARGMIIGKRYADGVFDSE